MCSVVGTKGEFMSSKILIALVSYDLAVHLAHLFRPREWWIKKGFIFWPALYGQNYDRFWAVYWLIGLLCAIRQHRKRT